MEMREQLRHSGWVRIPTYRDGELEWYGCELREIAQQHGTPVHVVAAGAIDSAYRRFRKPFVEAGLPIEIYYSVKTNPLPAYLNRLNNLGGGFETVSDFDLRLLKKLDRNSGPIIHTGDSRLLCNHPVALEKLRMITLSTPDQLEKLIQLQRQVKRAIPVGLTINPHLVRGYWDITLNTSRRGCPLGFRPGSKPFHNTVQKITDHPDLDLVGLQLHLGSGIRSAAPYIKGIQSLELAALSLKKNSHAISLLDIGGGFGLPDAPSVRILDMITSLLGVHTNKEHSPRHPVYLERIARQLTKTVHSLRQSGILIRSIAAEPGRLLSGGCQLLILTVQDVIHRSKRENFLFCDAGAMSLSPMLLTERHRVLSLREKNQTGLRHYKVHGMLPSSLDMVSPSADLPEMEPGDRIAVLDTGAYFLSMNNRFCGPLPPLVWVDNREAKLVRTRETLHTVLGRDRLP